MKEDRLAGFQKRIGHRFRVVAFLTEALTHSSAKGQDRPSNERFEFFGDAVLGLVVSEELLKRFPDSQEGDLTRRKSALVSRAALLKIAQRIGVAKSLLAGPGVGRLPPSIQANAVESVIAAVYLDAGLKAARALILRLYGDVWGDASSGAENAKSMLQQVTQRRAGVAPHYVLLAEQGPDHKKTFRVAVRLGGKDLGRGSGPTKKEAEQRAAAAALAHLGESA